MKPLEFERLRDTMIERHLKARGVGNPDVPEAMREVPRKAFVPESMVTSAYKDSPPWRRNKR
jgi:protein-L-isoaspartate O-methyltransferase